MTRMKLAGEVVRDLAPWAKAFGVKLVAYTSAGYLAGYAASGLRGAALGCGIGGLYVSAIEFVKLYKSK